MTQEEEIKINIELLGMIPEEEKKRVFNARNCMIDSSFLGFIETYKYLAAIIPKEYTVYDFGCGYNPQCYYFKDHNKYIAINPYEIDSNELFKTPNCDIYRMTTKEFLETIYNKEEKEFSICNYVPDWYNHSSIELVRKNFNNCFTFYPS